MKKLQTTLLALASLTAAAAVYAVGTQAPAALTSAGGPRPSYNGHTGLEIHTAAIHANQARAAGDLGEAKDHLHHVINCLEGPTGPDYNAKAEDPCAHMGRGALNDVQADSDEHRLLSEALDTAKNALTLTTVRDINEQGKQIESDIEQAEKDTQQ